MIPKRGKNTNSNFSPITKGRRKRFALFEGKAVRGKKRKRSVLFREKLMRVDHDSTRNLSHNGNASYEEYAERLGRRSILILREGIEFAEGEKEDTRAGEGSHPKLFLKADH